MRQIARVFPYLLAVALVAVAAPAAAQGTITQGAATFVLDAAPFDTTPAASFRGVSTPTTEDHVFETGWWYRVAGDAAETFFPAPDTQSYVGNLATLTWNNVNSRGFSAQLVYTVTDSGGPSGKVSAVMTVTNLSAAGPITVNVFHMLDCDLQLTAGNDVGASLGGTAIRVTHASDSDFLEYRGIGADFYAVLAWSSAGTTDVAGILSNAVADDFTSTGLPFAAGDITMGMQWRDRAIAASGNAAFTAEWSVNVLVPVELMGFDAD